MKVHLLALVAVLGLGLVTACGDDNGGAAANGQGGKVRAVGVGSADFSSLDLTEWQRLLKTENVDFELKFLEEADATLRAVVAGAADMYIGDINAAVTAIKNTKAPVKVIAANTQSTDYVVLARKGINSINDLAGKTIGVNTPGSAGDVIMKMALTKQGYDVDKSKYVVIGGTSARVAALTAGQIDATVAHFADAQAAIATGNFVALVECGPALGGLLQTGLIASTAWLDKNPELAQKVVDRLIDASRWATKDKAGYLKRSEEFNDKLKPEVKEAAYDTFVSIKYFGVNGGLDTDQVDNYVSLFQTAGVLPKDMPAKGDWLDDKYVKNYLERNGRV
ncbi:ABC transporter substrate-binding protein [Dactylosporangium sp. AC04546]|uniref:ABC transporter substrate-binding protein n=1 Tax=Dactylosporangium sp. AC04546 TaxID=2862460 RepID=UPI001EE01B94|nr:ABC transporter substrate-binding protein [Dactylosporangium sp. AC04546]WVK78771.1 ABC transporter substrate-binding protein [Dactylosporangium sp. AC04546]